MDGAALKDVLRPFANKLDTLRAFVANMASGTEANSAMNRATGNVRTHGRTLPIDSAKARNLSISGASPPMAVGFRTKKSLRSRFCARRGSEALSAFAFQDGGGCPKRAANCCAS